MTPALLTASRPVLRHHPLGASTGYMAGRGEDWEALVAEAQETSAFTVELSALGEEELPGLLDFLVEADDLPFRYLSVHAPSKRLGLPERERVALLAGLPEQVDAIVVHPDTIEEPARWAALGDRLVLENMDGRKAGARTARELAPSFAALPEAGLCFDVAHAWSIDPSLREGHAILDAFGDRLRHLHVSSLDAAGRHVELRERDEAHFGPLLARCRDVPWILEAALTDA